MRLRKKIKQMFRVFKDSWYTHFYYKKGLSSQLILFDSKNGIDLGSNLLRLLEEITNNSYGKYKIVVSCKKEKTKMIRTLLENYRIHGVKIVKTFGFRYYRILGIAHYLFTDTTFPRLYMKKEGQVCVNTWHGTPLKKMGKDVDNRAFAMGNVQKNFLMADYLIYPSDYMKDIMVNSYNLANLYKGKILSEGYPRNSVFFQEERRLEVKKALGLNGKKIYSYMPTWRGTLNNLSADQQRDQLSYYFHHLDRELGEDEIFFVRLHPFIADTIDYSIYNHIKPFPEAYEPYDILNISDCLVTDYSSVFFDFVNSRKKIVLFVYDKEAYLDERGLYFHTSELPFPQVRSLSDLITQIRSPKEYDDERFRQRFCTYDNLDAASRLCRHILRGENVCKEEQVSGSGKENVLLYSGSLSKNGLTSSLLNLFANVDLDKRNYYVSFQQALLAKAPLRYTLLPDKVNIIPISSALTFTVAEAACYFLHYSKGKDYAFVHRYLKRLYEREFKRHFGYAKLDIIIQFHGYEQNIINMFRYNNLKKVIFVHNDMVSEIKTRRNAHYPTLRAAYNEFDKVAVVTQDIMAPTVTISGKQDNVVIVNNCLAHKEIVQRSHKEIAFDPDTECNIPFQSLLDIFNGVSTKIITIGRFSGEKGHKMLIDAYNKYYNNNTDSYLIIIGGHGVLYQETLSYAANKKCAKNIIIIKSMSNPMPILKCCDLFVLSSLYEGLGLTLLEADTLRIPTISTDIVGPQGFMREHNGYLVPPTAEGIYEGMLAFDRGEVNVMGVDYDAYNLEAVAQFEALLEGVH